MANQTYQTFDEGDSFWELYNQLNPSYRAQLDPYLSYSYKNGIWDRVGNFLDFNTGEDRYRMQMQAQARQMLASLQGDVFQNDRNSAQQQVAREKDAGVNPDLNADIQGEPASGAEQPIMPIDPSIFEVPKDILVDIASFFGTAASGLQSVQTFKKLAADKRLSEVNAIKGEIESVDKAWETAGNWLTSFDPTTRISFDDIHWEDIPEKDRPKALEEAIVNAFHSDISGISKQSQDILKKAFLARTKDPAVMDEYYKNYAKAAESRVKKIAAEQTYGSLDLADDVVTKQNEVILNYMESAIKSQWHLNSIINDYNVQKTQNDFDYERFKHDKKLPEQLVESELQGYLYAQAKNVAEKARAKAFKDWLDELLGLKKSHDPGAIYLLNALLQGGYAPLLTTSGKLSAPGGLGFSGSWQNMITPGGISTMNPLGEKVVESITDPSANK